MTTGARVAVCVLMATTALAQSDIVERLRRVLPPGEAETACDALWARQFGRVEALLARSAGEKAAQREELLAVRGAVEFLDGKMNGAAATFREAAQLGPLTEGDRFTMAMALVELGEHEQARSALGDLAAEHPERALYVYWLGRIDYDQHRYQEAVEKLTRTTELDPRSPRAWDSLGLAFDMQGRMEQALTAFQKAVSLNRELAAASPWPPHDLGYLLLRMERFGEADAALRESLRHSSGVAQTHLYLGRVLEKEDKAEEAVAEYRSAVSLDKASPDACYSLAMLYRKLHRDREAEAMFAQWRERRPSSQPVAVTEPDKVFRDQ